MGGFVQNYLFFFHPLNNGLEIRFYVDLQRLVVEIVHNPSQIDAPLPFPRQSNDLRQPNSKEHRGLNIKRRLCNVIE